MPPFSIKYRNGELTVPAIVASLVLGSGFLASDTALRSSRPTFTGVPTAGLRSGQVIPGRLWEDPFAVAAEQIKETAATQCWLDCSSFSEKSAHLELLQAISLGHFAAGATGNRNLLLMPVFVPGSGYAESSERRLRTRYAVLSALAVAGYVPSDAERLGVLSIDLGDPSLCVVRPAAIPFEWFQPQQASACLPYSDIAVLWISDLDIPGATMVPSLETVVGALYHRIGTNARTVTTGVIGPYDSDDLLDLERTCAGSLPSTLAATHTTFITATATIADSDIAALSPRKRLEELCLVQQLHLKRSIASDDRLASLLAHELSLRKLRKVTAVTTPDGRTRYLSGRVIMVSEWDTSYARRLAKSFKNALKDEFNLPATPDADVDRYTYFRGVDGAGTYPAIVPRSDGNAEEHSSLLSSPNGRGAQERPESTSQFDYLRRLCERIQDDVRELGPVTAIGLVGTDVYDKLLVLQVLRSHFPGVVFFTTDLDARLCDPEQYPWTRNLVIASSYDLRLGRSLQVYAPTFRDSYQTSTFVATLKTVGWHPSQPADFDRMSPAVDLGRVYEIGRSGHVDLTPHRGKAAFYPPAEEPTLLPLIKSPQLAGLIAALLLVVTGLPFAVQWARRRKTPTSSVESVPARLAMWVLSLIAVALLLIVLNAMLICSATPIDEHEPFAWLEGVSVWPSVVIRIFAGLLAAVYACILLANWNRNLEELSSSYGLALDSVRRNPWEYVQYSLRSPFIWMWRVPGPASRRLDLQELWQEYQRRGTLPVRLFRTTIWTLVLYGVLWFLFVVLPHAPAPTRGSAAAAWNFYTVKCVPLVVIGLGVFVWDGVNLCDRLVRHLTTPFTRIPRLTRRAVCDRTGLTGLAAEGWLETSLIGSRTACIGRSVYYPFAAVLILILARNQRFDLWTWNIPVTASLLSTLAITVLSAWTLDRTAARARSLEVEQLRARSTRLSVKAARAFVKGAHARRLTSEVSMLTDAIERIEKNKEGAFSPWRSNPIVSAILLPAGSLVLATLMEYAMSRL